MPRAMQGMLLNSDSFPGQDRSKLCMASKVHPRALMQFSHYLGQTSRDACLSMSDYYTVLCCKGRQRQLSVC